MLCHMLRHSPNQHNVTINAEGWANANQVLWALRFRRRRLCLWQPWTICHLSQFVEQHSARFELNGNHIRARYGHSLPVTVGEIRTPPPVLFHGTADYYLNAIRMLGLKAYTRTFVHLTSDSQYAFEVAEAKDGTPITLSVRAADAATTARIVFRQATAHVWLVSNLPAQFVNLSASESLVSPTDRRIQ